MFDKKEMSASYQELSGDNPTVFTEEGKGGRVFNINDSNVEGNEEALNRKSIRASTIFGGLTD